MQREQLLRYQLSKWCHRGVAAAVVLLMGMFGCGGGKWQTPPCPNYDQIRFPAPTLAPEEEEPEDVPTVVQAEEFVAKVELELHRSLAKREQADWVYYNFLSMDTEAIASAAAKETMSYLRRTIKEATRFDSVALPDELRRKLHLLKLKARMPAPDDPAQTAELAKILSRMAALYGKGSYCPTKGGNLERELRRILGAKKYGELQCDGKGEGGFELGALSKVIEQSRNVEALREAWIGWRKVSPPMRGDYARAVALGNEGAKQLGFADVGEIWRGGYDMSPAKFRADAERLFRQVKPLYDDLHCYVRMRLRQHYGKDDIAEGAPIPAHLLGNMWSQTWSNIYPLVEPHRGQPSLNVTRKLKAQKYDAEKMVRLSERMFTSLGFDKLPKSFYDRSLFTKPTDRKVVCHASAWDVTYEDDLRIKMCININEEDLFTIHHELGHIYYYHYYNKLPFLFQDSANDGFHEAIGDTIGLSLTPQYFKSAGLLARVPKNHKATLNYLMKMALEKVAFLPFGKLIDQWRWDVFAGKITPGNYNKGWWDLRREYQGIAPPVARTEKDFDPGAKYHVPANVPYTRYFLAFIYQFQFHRALCCEIGHTGPPHTCSIAGNKAAGRKLIALLKMGATKPWQEALFTLTGKRKADASAMVEYFAELRTFLQKQIKKENETCGW